MYPVKLLFRIAKAIAVAAIGLMALLVVYGNVTDYYTNYHFVEHVMRMDTIFPDTMFNTEASIIHFFLMRDIYSL